MQDGRASSKGRTIAIMQPYFFPYLGYFQLIKAVDLFVILDDVQWTRGWINRNRILVQGRPHYITLPLRKASARLPVDQQYLALDFEDKRDKIFRTISGAYGTAPFYSQVIDLLGESFSFPSFNLADFLVNSLRVCCHYMGINTPFVHASRIESVELLKGEERLIHIAEACKAERYVNPIGGRSLYNRSSFDAKDVQLLFLKMRDVAYDQFQNSDFVPALSIIDVMMFNPVGDIQNLLDEYDLISPCD